MVGACIEKRSGQGLYDFLKPRFFEKVGILPEHIRWMTHANGLENGSGGLVSTARSNALMMELYRRGGCWNGESILSKAWVDFALQPQNKHVSPGDDVAYCGMMWQRGPYLTADGAMGQWAMLFPKEDLVISINQVAPAGEPDARVKQAILDFVATLDTHSDEDAEAAAALARKLRTLAIPAPAYAENPALLRRIAGKKLRITAGATHFFADDLGVFREDYVVPIHGFGFDMSDDNLLLRVRYEGGESLCPVGLKGQRLLTYVQSPNPACTAALSGFFPAEDQLELELRWLESCRVHRLRFAFTPDGAHLSISRDPVGGFDVPDETATAVWDMQS
jgi:hypothetical protein